MNRDDMRRIIARAMFDYRVGDKPGAWDDQGYEQVIAHCFDEASRVIERLVAAGLQVEPGPEPNKYIITMRDGNLAIKQCPPASVVE